MNAGQKDGQQSAAQSTRRLASSTLSCPFPACQKCLYRNVGSVLACLSILLSTLVLLSLSSLASAWRGKVNFVVTKRKSSQDKAHRNSAADSSTGQVREEHQPVEFRDDPECSVGWFNTGAKVPECLSPVRSPNFNWWPKTVSLSRDNGNDNATGNNNANNNDGVGNTDDNEEDNDNNGSHSAMQTRDTIQTMLRDLWGLSSPSVDLYFRTGCASGGFQEMTTLLEWVELFWPNFLGSVVIVADAGDKNTANVIPNNTKQRYKIHYENVPRLAPRLFNQYSYMHADKHCDAEFIVTIDADCVFMLPVSPRLLFRDYGTPHMRVVLSSHSTWQNDLWPDGINVFYDGRLSKGQPVTFESRDILYKENHMVTQPVTFRRDTLVRWRDFMRHRNGLCVFMQMSLADSLHVQQWPTSFCWMCLIGTWIIHTPSEQKRYEIVRYSDSQSEGTCRFAAHWMYENPVVKFVGGYHQPGKQAQYQQAARALILGGLCRMLQRPACSFLEHRWVIAVDEIMFGYNLMPNQWPPQTIERLKTEFFGELASALRRIGL